MCEMSPHSGQRLETGFIVLTKHVSTGTNHGYVVYNYHDGTESAHEFASDAGVYDLTFALIAQVRRGRDIGILYWGLRILQVVQESSLRQLQLSKPTWVDGKSSVHYSEPSACCSTHGKSCANLRQWQHRRHKWCSSVGVCSIHTQVLRVRTSQVAQVDILNLGGGSQIMSDTSAIGIRSWSPPRVNKCHY